MNDWTLVSWNDGRKKYREGAERLRAACERYGHRHHIVEVDVSEHMARQISEEYNYRHWVCRYHYTFMLACLQKLNTDILYSHADWPLRSPITPESWGGLDVGLQDARSHGPDRANHVLAAPIFIKNNDRGLRFVRLVEAALLLIDDGKADHGIMNDVRKLMKRRDRAIRFGTFDPILASVKLDDPTPLAKQ